LQFFSPALCFILVSLLNIVCCRCNILYGTVFRYVRLNIYCIPVKWNLLMLYADCYCLHTCILLLVYSIESCFRMSVKFFACLFVCLMYISCVLCFEMVGCDLAECCKNIPDFSPEVELFQLWHLLVTGKYVSRVLFHGYKLKCF